MQHQQQATIISLFICSPFYSSSFKYLCSFVFLYSIHCHSCLLQRKTIMFPDDLCVLLCALSLFLALFMPSLLFLLVIAWREEWCKLALFIQTSHIPYPFSSPVFIRSHIKSQQAAFTYSIALQNWISLFINFSIFLPHSLQFQSTNSKKNTSYNSSLTIRKLAHFFHRDSQAASAFKQPTIDEEDNMQRPCEPVPCKSKRVSVLRVQLAKLRPVSTSSTVSLLKLATTKASRKRTRQQEETSNTNTDTTMNMLAFDVECTSTPKKAMPRSSTRNHLLAPLPEANHTTAPITSPAHKITTAPATRSRHATPFSSTVLSTYMTSLVTASGAGSKAKAVPPPLFSSSIIDEANAKRRPSETGATNKRRTACHCRSSCSGGVSSKKAKRQINLAQQQQQQDVFVQRTLESWRNLKYPIKYFPNVKSRDINRLSDCATDACFGSTMTSSSRQQVIKPVLKSCYSHGAYNVWVVWDKSIFFFSFFFFFFFHSNHLLLPIASQTPYPSCSFLFLILNYLF